MSHARRISVHVDEPDPQVYHWVLMESTQDASVWVDLEASEESYPTWLAALNAGTDALLKLVPNKDRGPLVEGEDENASPVG